MNKNSTTIKSLSLTTVGLIFFTLGIAESSQANLFIFNDRSTFDNVAPGLPLEDFEEANLDSNPIVNTGPVIDSTTDNGVFSPGDILPGLQIASNDGSDLGVAGPGSGVGNNTKTVGANNFASSTDVIFLEPINAVGLDVFNPFGSMILTLSIFGESGLLGTQSVADGSFFGVISDIGPITKINVSGNGISDTTDFVDNIAFGMADPPPVNIPEPRTILGLGTLLSGLLLSKKRLRN